MEEDKARGWRRDMVKTLYTTGYSGFQGEDFVWKLNLHDISVVVDVRASAASRNRQFAKENLKSLLEKEGITYVHYPQLGVPGELRKRLQGGESLSRYFKEYRKVLAHEQEAIDELHSLAVHRRCCLLCLENKPEECHRSELAKVVAKCNGSQLEIEHI